MGVLLSRLGWILSLRRRTSTAPPAHLPAWKEVRWGEVHTGESWEALEPPVLLPPLSPLIPGPELNSLESSAEHFSPREWSHFFSTSLHSPGGSPAACLGQHATENQVHAISGMCAEHCQCLL